MGTVPPEYRIIVERCIKLVGRWRHPPNWSRGDWLVEVAALIAASTWSALSAYDAGVALPLGMFTARRALAAALAFYRCEWAYASRCVSIPCEHAVGPSSPCLQCRLKSAALQVEGAHSTAGGCSCPLSYAGISADDQAVADAVASLGEPERVVVRRLFWQGYTEEEVGHALGISQQAVSKRKRQALHSLRERLTESASRIPDSRW